MVSIDDIVTAAETRRSRRNPQTQRDRNVSRFNELKTRRGRNTSRAVSMRHPGHGPLASAYQAANDIASTLQTPVAYMTPGVGDYMAHQDAVEKYSKAKELPMPY